MGILDDAIREHLELKRRHGASDEEVAQQEAEALGPARREPAASARAEDAAPAGDDLGGAPPPPDPQAAASLTDDAPPPPPDAAGLADEAPAVEDIEPLHAEPSALDPLDPPAGVDPPDVVPPTEAMPVAELPDDPFGDPVPVRRGPGRSVPLGDDDPLATPVDPVEAIEPEAAEEILPPDDPAAAAEPGDADLHDDATRVRPLPPLDDDALPPAPAVPPPADEPAGLDEPTRVRPAPGPEDEPTSERRPAEPSEDVLEETPDFLQDTPDHDRLWFEQRPPRDFDFDD